MMASTLQIRRRQFGIVRSTSASVTMHLFEARHFVVLEAGGANRD